MNFNESPWKDLIEVYAANPVRTITTQPTYQKLCAQYVGKDGFPAARSLVEKIAVNVQNRMSKALGLGPTAETAAGLELLKRTRGRPDEMEIYYALITKGYNLTWSPAQRTYFEQAYQKLSLPYDFFFSFSTRYEHVASENPVNNIYKHFILKVLTPTDWESADRKKENLLAKAIYTLMAENKGHKGFYFPDSQYDNTFTEEKLEKSLGDSHVFVQMVQNVMFRPPSQGENYCHFEFVRAHQQLEAERQVEHRMLFLIAEREQAFMRAEDVYPDYELWYLQTIKRKDVPYVPEVPAPLDADVRYQQIKTLIEDKLVALIDAAWDRLIDNVPQ
jgi:hypothetical protein